MIKMRNESIIGLNQPSVLNFVISCLLSSKMRCETEAKISFTKLRYESTAELSQFGVEGSDNTLLSKHQTGRNSNKHEHSGGLKQEVQVYF